MRSNRQPKILKEIRLKYKLSQEKMAKQLGYSGAQFISNSERGMCDLPEKNIPKISKLYGRKYAMAMIAAKIDDYTEKLCSMKL